MRYEGAKLFAPGTVDEPIAPNRLRWDPPADLPAGGDFVDGLVTMMANRDPADLTGVAIHLYRADKSMEGVKIIIVSGVVNQDEINDLLKAGADEFVKKPFNIEKLIERVGELLNVAV